MKPRVPFLGVGRGAVTLAGSRVGTTDEHVSLVIGPRVALCLPSAGPRGPGDPQVPPGQARAGRHPASGIGVSPPSAVPTDAHDLSPKTNYT